MEYLVTMTTRVPDDVTEGEVTDVREREAAHTRQLAGAGGVLRLWRPPLAPGEWRTIGLFVADGSTELEQTLAAMPLRVWRTDEVTPLGAHPNDPGRDRVTLDVNSSEFFTTFVLTVPPGTSAGAVAAARAGEADRARELAAEGRLLRLWALPGEGHSLGHWQAPGEEELREILHSLPLADWLAVDTVRLTRHPSDPATAPATT